MSARDKEFDRIIGLEKVADDYAKPSKELVLRVINLIRRIYKDEAEHIKVDDMKLMNIVELSSKAISRLLNNERV